MMNDDNNSSLLCIAITKQYGKAVTGTASIVINDNLYSTILQYFYNINFIVVTACDVSEKKKRFLTRITG